MKEVLAVRNLTPHQIKIIGDKTYPPDGVVARCKATTKSAGEIAGIPITRTVMGEVEGLPHQKKDTILIVSRIIAEALPQRDDLFIPNETVRDEKGQIIGCRSLCTLQK